MALEELINKLRIGMLERSQFAFSNNSSILFRGDGVEDGFSGFSFSAMNRTKTSTSNSSFLNWDQRVKDWTKHLSGMLEEEDTSKRDAVVIFFYTLIVIISIFGNVLVCRVVFRGRAMRSTTNLFIGNLSVSDLLMTILNIPFNVARLLLDNWPFGPFLCSSLPFVQVVSVYVSTFTMTCISLDRYQVISNPFKPRGRSHSARIKITVIWVIAIVLSTPYPIFNEVQEVFTYRALHRCRVVYPEPVSLYRMWVTILSLLTQYIIPLAITGIAYIKIVYLVWYRQVVGAVTDSQRMNQQKAKWKTIKMLIVVVVVFAICWTPLNVYHAYHDFNSMNGPTKHKSNIFMVCHWIAMSSVCYNPFIYCWLNDTFRAVARSHLRCFGRARKNYRSFSASPPSCRFGNQGGIRSALFYKGGRKYQWDHEHLRQKQATGTVTSCSVRSQDSLQSSFNSSSQKSPTTVITFFPLETHVEHSFSCGTIYPLALDGNRKSSSLGFTCKNELTAGARRSRSLEASSFSNAGERSETVV